MYQDNSLESRMKRAGVWGHPKVMRMYARHMLHKNDDSGLLTLLDKAEMFAKLRGMPFMQEPTIEQVRGNILLGHTVLNNVPYCLDTTSTAMHGLLIAGTQRGKTTLMRLIMRGARGKVAVWVIDPKGDYHHLFKEDPTLRVIQPSSPLCGFKFNPYEPPPGSDAHSWASENSDCFCNSMDLLEASASLDSNSYYALESALNRVPTFDEHLEYIKNMQLNSRENYRTLGARDSVVSRREMLKNYFGDCFNCQKGHPIESLANQNIVWMLSDVPKSARTYFTMLILSKLLHYRRNMNDRGAGVLNIVFVDEAKGLFAAYRDKNNAAGLSKASVLVTLTAEFRIMIIASDQDMSAISQILKDNCGWKVNLGVYGGENLNAVAADFALNQEQKEFNYAQELGMFTVRDKRVPFPFECKFPFDDFIKDVQAQVAQAATAAWLRTLSWTPAKSGKPVEPKPDPRLADLRDKLLRHIYEKPLLTATDRQGQFCAQPRIEKDIYYDVRAYCMKQKLVEQVSTNPTGEKGKNILLYELTKAGCALIDVPQTRPGVEHRFLQEFIAQLGQQRGLLAQKEKVIAGIRVDVLLTKPGGWACAVEIALDQAYEAAKLPALLGHVQLACLLCKNPYIVKQLRVATDQVIAKELRWKVRIDLISAAYKDEGYFGQS